MKKKILLLMGIFSIGITYAQIGINTDTPQSLFHIDPKSNTNGAVNTADDVVITANGNMGIGTLTPSVKLEINTGGTPTNVIKGFKLIDGSQGNKKILVRDDGSDNTYWEHSVSGFKSLAGFSKANLSYSTAQSTLYSGYSITFPEPGIYWVTIGIMLIDNKGVTNKKYIAQLMTNNNAADWGNPAMLFGGTSEVYAENTNGNPRIYFCQSLTVPAGQLTAYMMLRVIDATASGSITFYLGENAYTTCPQCTGGSYVRIA